MTRTSLGIATQQGTPSLLPISTRRCSATCCSLPTRRPSWRHAHHQEVAVGEAIPAEQTHRSVSCAARAARAFHRTSSARRKRGRAVEQRCGEPQGGHAGSHRPHAERVSGAAFWAAARRTSRLAARPPKAQTRRDAWPWVLGRKRVGIIGIDRGKVIRGNSRTKTDERSHGLTTPKEGFRRAGPGRCH